MAGNEAPPFWYEKRGWQAAVLSPLAAIYGWVARRRMDHAEPQTVPVPVICIGNLTVGGTGKTPTAIALAEALKARKYKPGFVSRGYGGSHIRPHRVDLAHDTAKAVGDEPMLLARHAPIVIGQNRAANARLLVDEGVDFIIMDDGFQSRTLHFDLAVITLDARRGIGNGAVIPAGPLRAPLRDQMRLADTILRIGEGDAGDEVIRAAARAAKPLMQAHLVPDNVRAISGKQVLAFTGIGDPSKFYETLGGFGCWLAATRSFPDHHMFTEGDARELLAKARSENLVLVTTEKDAVRLSHNEGPLAELREATHVLPVKLVFETRADIDTIVARALTAFSDRKLKQKPA